MTAWYEAPDSACPDCGHGPKWHDDPTGCVRMAPSWCPCPYVYSPDAAAPDDRTADHENLAHYLRWRDGE